MTSNRILSAAVMLLALTGSGRAMAQARPAVNHIALYVYDLQKSTNFYQNVLGLRQISEPFKDGRHVWFRMGPHSQLHLIQGAARVEEHAKDTHLAFRVKDLGKFTARLDQSATPYSSWTGEAKQTTARPDGVKQVYLQDPDKFWIEVNDDKF
ncbi:VOC family protein [Hymenobacter sp. 5516J-16]|uniref:VOC family protein n=1 Tax=Hymenobacter sublimis TaxID=2933777 RepID=A0ABY4J5X4_9BACT|nr:MULTISPECIES: VOC family protein [Hymenobacter]UOQ78181.1 VOC family protein [Hymenobacter sp. 5516J-16]UPL48163.1 VOC family protein [Hymenobacter sublimis]